MSSTDNLQRNTIDKKQYVSMAASTAAMLSAGTIYMFSLFGPQLKQKLGYSQSQISFIGSCANSGVFISGPILGYIVDNTSNSSKNLFYFSAFLLFSSYTLISQTYSQAIPYDSWILLSFYFFCIGVGSSGVYHRSLKFNLKNWPLDLRSIAIGIPVSAFGLSALFFTQISTLIFAHNVQYILLFIGSSTALIILIVAQCLKDVSYLITPIPQPNIFLGETDRLINDDVEEEVDESCFKHRNAYLLALTMSCLCGIGVMYINNVGSIILSLHPKETTPTDPAVRSLQSFHVMLFSLMNFSGRFFSGFLIDAVGRIIPKSFLMVITTWVIITASLLGGYALNGDIVEDERLLSVITAGVGLGYGLTWTGIPVLVNEFFGSQRFATHWGFMTLMPAFGGLFLSFIFGRVFDAATDNDYHCLGTDCFATSFKVCMILAIISSCVFCWIFGEAVMKRVKRTRIEV